MNRVRTRATGAHNQRSHVPVTARTNAHISIEEWARVAGKQASCELHCLLKRPDEKFVIERTCRNPKCVEYLVHNVSTVLNRYPRSDAYVVESEKIEPIHHHSAYALPEHRLFARLRRVALERR
jgi:GTP cyclohydrolase IB